MCTATREHVVVTMSLPAPTWFRLVGLALLAAFVVVVCVLWSLSSVIGPSDAVVSGLPSVILLAAGWSMVLARIELRVESGIVRLRYVPVWQKTLDTAEIDEVSVQRREWSAFLGIGLRVVPGRVALVFGSGDVLVIWARSGRQYIVQCPDPRRAERAVSAVLREREHAD